MAKTGTRGKNFGAKFLQLFINYRILKTNFTIVIITIFLLAALHFALAVTMYVAGHSLLDRRLGISEGCLAVPCSLNFKVLDTIQGPVHFYIAYEDFYLNHRKVMSSIDTRQFDGKTLTLDELHTSCGNYTTVGDSRRFVANAEAGQPEDAPLAFCGLFPMLFIECGLIR